jgi:two-component system, OmpR family, sensor histidine kinase BaeS
MAERPTPWRDRLGVRLGAAFTATALVAVAAVTAVALLATRSGVAELTAEQRARTVDDVVAALQTAYVVAGGWEDADLLPAHTLAAAAGAVLIVTAADLGQLPAPPELDITRRQLRDRGVVEDTDGDAHHDPDGGTVHDTDAGPGADEGTGGIDRRRERPDVGPGGSSGGATGEGPATLPAGIVGGERPVAAASGAGARRPPSALAVTLPAGMAAGGTAPLPAVERSSEEDDDGVHVDIVVDGRQVGTATLLFVERDLPDATEAFQAQLGRSLVVGAAAAALTALAVTAFVTSRLTRPLRRLTGAVERLRRGAPVLPPEGAHPSAPGEIGVLAAAMDGMADDLRRQEHLRRALVADVGHELRTPVTILLGELEALRDGVLPLHEEELSSLHEEVQRIARLVEDVDSLADAEASGFALERGPLELAALVADAARGYAQPFAAADLTLVPSLVPVEVVGDRRRLEQVVRNLLSNALRHAPPGTSVDLEVAEEGAEAVLQVADRGPGFDPAELPHVFERFWRGEAASTVGGSGIGLAVVAEVVAAHGGQAAAANRPGGGAVLTVRLPRATRSAGPSPVRAGASPPVVPPAARGGRWSG